MDDFLPGVDNGLGLLAAEHHLRDLRGIGQMRQPGFLDEHAGLGYALLQFFLQCLRYFIHAAA